MRQAAISRNTKETQIELKLNLDGNVENSRIDTGIGFFDHMLILFAYHGNMELELKCIGDINVDYHHTVEDVGIALGSAIAKSLGDKAGIKRYGSMLMPMDEALVEVALDISGRPFLIWDVDFVSEKVGDFDAELGEEFFRALAFNAGITLHIRKLSGVNTHHIFEAIFKGVARGMRKAMKIDKTIKGIPSTKGIL